VHETRREPAAGIRSGHRQREYRAQMAKDASTTWGEFLDWLPTAEPRGDVEGMLLQYRSWIGARGGSEDDAHHAMGVIMRSLNDPATDGRIEAWRLLFDKVYLSDQPVFNQRPNALLAETVSSLEPGAALDVCMGEGRNAVWLAERGWQVTGVDVSPEGIGRARERAGRAGVKLTFIRQEADAFDYSCQRWHLVVVSYAPVPIVDPRFVARLTDTLVPGGVVVVESFGSDREAPRRRPVDIDPDELRTAFASFDIRQLDDVVERPDWADAPERLVRMVAVKR
jgi:SAM-dependent methyltransferase